MSNTTIALEKILTRSFDEKQRTLANLTGLTPGMISKLVSGTQSLTHKTLAALCDHLDPTDARHLSLAACRDILPADLAEEITLSEHPNLVTEPPPEFNALDPKSEKILAQLRTLCRQDPATRDWLHHLADWMFDE